MRHVSDRDQQCEVRLRRIVMATVKNPFGKTRKVEEPYATYRGPEGWEWRVLKTYQRPDKEESNMYARWLCAVKSPYTYDSFEFGDTYVHDVLASALLVDADKEWEECYVN